MYLESINFFMNKKQKQNRIIKIRLIDVFRNCEGNLLNFLLRKHFYSTNVLMKENKIELWREKAAYLCSRSIMMYVVPSAHNILVFSSASCIFSRSFYRRKNCKTILSYILHTTSYTRYESPLGMFYILENLIIEV